MNRGAMSLGGILRVSSAFAPSLGEAAEGTG